MNETLRIAKELVKYKVARRREEQRRRMKENPEGKFERTVNGGSDAPKQIARCH